MDVIMSSPGLECSGMENDRADGAGKLSKSQKRRKRKLLKERLHASLESFDKSEGTGNPKSKPEVPGQNVDIITQSSVLDGLNTGQGTTATVDQKMTVPSSAASGDENGSISKAEGYVEVAKGEKGSSRTTTVDVKTRSEREDHMEIANDKRDSSRNATLDAKIVSKREEHMEIANGEIGCSSAIAARDAKSTVSKRERHVKIASETGSSRTAITDANTGSKREECKETANGETVSGRTATPDAKTVSKGEEHTEVTNGEMGSSATTNLNVQSTVQKKKKQKSCRRKPTLGEILNPRYLEDMETANGETGSGTTATNNTTSKKRKRQKLKNKKPASGDSLNTCENTQDRVIAKKGFSTTKVLEAMSAELKRKGYPKIASGEKCPRTTAALDAKGTTLKSVGCTEIANSEMGSSRTTTIDENTGSSGIATPDAKSTVSESDRYMKIANGETDLSNTTAIDAKTVSKVEECTKVGNGETGSSTTTTLIAKSTAPQNVKWQKRKKPTLGDILNPRYLEDLEIAEANRALSRKISKQLSRKRRKEKLKNKQAPDLNTHENAKHKEIGKITPVVALRKKLLIFDVNGLLADIVSPPPKDCKADKYLPKRAIFKRPFLDDFLCFCFERFNVGIWSSRTKKILDPVVDYLLGDLKKKLLFLWDADSCTNSGMRTLEDKHKCIVFKNLRKIWEKNGPSDSWVKGFFDESNTLLLDDSPYKALLNPKHTGIFPLSYSYKNTNDDFLGPEGGLRIYLEGVAATDNVKMYVEQHPFGKGAIDDASPHWAFYSRVLKGQNSYAC